MELKKKYNDQIFKFINKETLGTYSDEFIDKLLTECEENCSLLGISYINSSNFNILVSNCMKNIGATKVDCLIILKNLVYSYIIMKIYNFNCKTNHDDIIDANKLLENYEEFIDLPEQEINNLLKFRNIIKIIINMFQTKMIKQICMDIASILEGTGKKYICGSGETIQTKRRVLIFRKEANIYPAKRNGYYKNKNKSKSKNNIKKIIKSPNKSIIKNINIVEKNFEYDTRFRVSNTSPPLPQPGSTDYLTSKISRSISISDMSNSSIKDEFISGKIILYEENIEKKLLHMFNNDISSEMNTY
jgi:hypothetical protein